MYVHACVKAVVNLRVNAIYFIPYIAFNIAPVNSRRTEVPYSARQLNAYFILLI